MGFEVGPIGCPDVPVDLSDQEKHQHDQCAATVPSLRGDRVTKPLAHLSVPDKLVAVGRPDRIDGNRLHGGGKVTERAPEVAFQARVALAGTQEQVGLGNHLYGVGRKSLAFAAGEPQKYLSVVYRL